MLYVEKMEKYLMTTLKKMGFPVNASGHNLFFLLVPKTATT